MSRKKSKGQSIIELAVGLIAVIPIVLVVFDLAIIIIAVQINDSTCREAARVAASGAPSDAINRANAVINRANAHSIGMVTGFALVPANTVTFTPAGIIATATSMIPYGGALQGTVNVKTSVQVKPFIVQHIYSGAGSLTFNSSQTFPITYVVPNTTP